jgi:phosphoglycerate dehydrogenase-like enzyme
VKSSIRKEFIYKMSDPIEVLITTPIPDPLLTLLYEVSPKFHFTLQPSASKVEDISPEIWARTDILYTGHLLPEPDSVPNLRWIQFSSSNTEFFIKSPLQQKPDLVATNLSGASSIQVAEHTLMMLLALGHHLPLLMKSQEQAKWANKEFVDLKPVELSSTTVGIIGYGSIGRQIAYLLRPFGATILATKREAMQPKDRGYAPDGLGDPQGNLFHRLYPIQAIKSMLHLCDFIVVSLPLTPETHNLIGAEELEAAKVGCFLIDISEGGIIDHEAVISALQEHHLAGAALDVFPEEPLPSTSPLWLMPNVILTPHISGVSRYSNERAITLFTENLNRFLTGQPLYNHINPDLGY